MLSSQIQLIERTTGRRFAAAPDGTVIRSNHSLGWRGITVEWHSIPPMEMPEHCLEGHRLMVHLGKPALFEWKEDDRWRQTLLKPGEFCLQTHRELNLPRWSDPLEFLAIALDPNLVSQWFQDTHLAEAIHFQPQRGQSDPIIARVAQRFQAELVNRNYGGALYGESLALTFCLHLLEQYCTHPKPLPKPRGKLSALQLRQFVEYVHEHLSNELSLVELANQVNLSVYHFTRLVKRSLNLSPHQYVLQTRIERAKSLMSTVRPNLGEIGLQVGFYDQAHFAKAFKHSVGVSPSQFLAMRSTEQEFTSDRNLALNTLESSSTLPLT